MHLILLPLSPKTIPLVTNENVYRILSQGKKLVTLTENEIQFGNN